MLRITESVSDRWVVTPGLAFTIPLSGSAAAERDHAGAERRVAALRVAEAEWDVWHAVGLSWIEWSSALLRVEETERLAAAVEELARSTARLAESGELPRTEAALFAIEAARLRNRLRRLQGEAEAAEARLRSRLGLAPEAPVTLVPALAGGPVRERSLPAHLSDQNPTLARLRGEYAAAERRLRLAICRQVPELVLGPLFESDAGQSRIGLAGAIPLPVLNGNRRAIAEARADRELARAAFETEYERLVGRWAAASARARSLAEGRREAEELLVPLVDRQLADALRLLELGEGGSLVLLESLQRVHGTKLELIETRAAEALAHAEVEYLQGPPTPGWPANAKEVTP